MMETFWGYGLQNGETQIFHLYFDKLYRIAFIISYPVHKH